MDNRQIDFEHQQFSIPEAAQHLRISRSMLYKLIAAGSVKPTKIGARTIISGASLSRYLKAAEEPHANDNRKTAKKRAA